MSIITEKDLVNKNADSELLDNFNFMFSNGFDFADSNAVLSVLQISVVFEIAEFFKFTGIYMCKHTHSNDVCYIRFDSGLADNFPNGNPAYTVYCIYPDKYLHEIAFFTKGKLSGISQTLPANIIYFNDGKIRRRDFYDDLGFLHDPFPGIPASVIFHHNGKPCEEVFSQHGDYILENYYTDNGDLFMFYDFVLKKQEFVCSM